MFRIQLYFLASDLKIMGYGELDNNLESHCTTIIINMKFSSKHGHDISSEVGCFIGPHIVLIEGETAE